MKNSNTISFYASPEVLQNCTKKKNSIPGWLFLGITLIIISIIMFVYKDSVDFNSKSSRDSYVVMEIIFIISGGLIFFASMVELFLYSNEENKLGQIYIMLTDEGVSGTMYDLNLSSSVRPFSVDYADIIQASLLVGSNNQTYIEIKTKRGIFQCYNMENNGQIVKMINEAVERVNSEPSVGAGTAYESGNHDIKGFFCMYCGTKLPEDAVFCTNCGKNQKQQ